MAAANIFEYRLDSTRTGVVSAREAISHFRFGFRDAAGTARPVRPTTPSEESTVRAYEQGSPRSPRTNRLPASLALVSLGATRPTNLSPSLSGWVEGEFTLPQGSPRSRLSTPAMPAIRHSTSMPAMPAMRSARQVTVMQANPETIIRQLNARLGKRRCQVDALLNHLREEDGTADSDLLVDGLLTLGSKSSPPLALPKDVLRRAVSLYATSDAGRVDVREFGRDLRSGYVRRSSEVREQEHLATDWKGMSRPPSVTAPTDGKRRLNVHQRAKHKKEQQRAKPHSPGRLPTTPEQSSDQQSPSLSPASPPSKKKSPEIPWWRAVGIRNQAGQRAATMLIESLKDVATDEGHVTRDKFHEVLWDLGVLQAFEDETNVLFGE